MQLDLNYQEAEEFVKDFNGRPFNKVMPRLWNLGFHNLGELYRVKEEGRIYEEYWVPVEGDHELVIRCSFYIDVETLTCRDMAVSLQHREFE